MTPAPVLIVSMEIRQANVATSRMIVAANRMHAAIIHRDRDRSAKQQGIYFFTIHNLHPFS